MMNLPPELMNQSQMSQMGMQGNKQEMGDQQEPMKILAHMTPDEVMELADIIMMTLGQPTIDPELNLWDFTPLTDIFEIPEISSAIKEALHNEKVKSFAEGGSVEPGRPIAPELEELRQEGRGQDTELVIITPELEKIFTEWSGKKPKTNPVTGFPEFGFFTEIFRVVAPIVGAVFGGPIGAALAGGLATKLTGGSWGKSLGMGALSGLGAFAAPMLGGAFQSAFPGASNALGGITRGVLGNTVGGALGNLFTPGAGGAGLLSSIAGLGGMAGKQGSEHQLANMAKNQGTQQGTSQGLLSSLLSPSTLIPLGAAGLMFAKGHKEDKRNAQDYENRQRQETESMRQKLGFNTPRREVKPFNLGEQVVNPSEEDIARGRAQTYFINQPGKYEYLSSGGAIRGSGKGQSDNIHKDIKKNSYIIDASSVSDIGDGSTDAGFRELNNYFAKIPSHPRNESKGGYIQAMVSDGEYEVPPEKVTALGMGSNEKGAHILKKLIQEVRSQKRTSGKKLPPKSKAIGGYLSKLNVA